MAEARASVGERDHRAPYRPARQRQPARQRLIVAGAFAGAVLIAVYAWGGYELGWRWTGLSSSVQLWDWLQVLALPVALGIAPLLLRHRRSMTRQHRTIVAATLLAFGVLVAAAYLIPLGWTGFTGNTLWDWLELMLLPLVVAGASLRVGRAGLTPRVAVAGLAAAGAFAVFVACGYLVPWTWTGFGGNTVWDWIRLLLVPLLVPTVLLPALSQRVTNRLAPPEDHT
jgi:cation transport ATPase